MISGNVCSGDLVGLYVPLKKKCGRFFFLCAPCARTNETSNEEPQETPQP